MINIFEKKFLILKNVYDIFFDEVHFVWINQDFSTLLKKIQKQKILVITLETAKISFITSTTKSFRQHKSYELSSSSETNIEKKRIIVKALFKKKNRDHMYISRQECS